MVTPTRPDTDTKPTTTERLKCHLLEQDEDGNPTDRCLCGFTWDTLSPRIGPICQECLDEHARRHPDKCRAPAECERLLTL